MTAYQPEIQDRELTLRSLPVPDLGTTRFCSTHLDSSSGVRMQIIHLGRVAITAGTPTAITGTPIKCHAVIVQPDKANTGSVSFGDSTVVHATGVGVEVKFLPPGTSGLSDRYVTPTPSSRGNALNATDFYVDGSHTNDNALVSLVVL